MPSRNRGKPKQNLRRYSALPPTSEERQRLSNALVPTHPPIILAVVGHTLVETHLENLLRQRLKRRDDDTWVSLIQEPGPISSFDKKSSLAYALGIIDDVTRDHLKKIALIRNSIVHSRKPLDFEHDLVRSELRKLKLPPQKRSRQFKEISSIRALAEFPGRGPSQSYISICYHTLNKFLDKELASLKAKTRRLDKKAQRQAMVNALMGKSGESPTGLLSMFLESHNSDPTTQSPGPSQVKHARGLLRPPRNKGE